MNQRTTKAILLKRINYGEADRILTVITQSEGKMSLLGKGTRRSKSKLAGGLELFSVTDISFIDGRSELKTIVGARLDTYFGRIVEDMNATMAAYEFLKLIDTYTEQHTDEEYFSLLQEALAALHEHETKLEHTQAWFMTQLLQTSGHGINVDHDLQGKPFSEEKIYQFSYDDMCFFEHKAGIYGPKHIKLLQLLGKIGKPSHLLKVQDADELIKDLLLILRRCVA